MRFVWVLLLCMWTGQAWAVCTRPDGVEGELVYNADQKLLQYCDGARWIGVGWKGTPVLAAGGVGQLQFGGGNDYLDGDARLIWDKDDGLLTVGGVVHFAHNIYNDLRISSVHDDLYIDMVKKVNPDETAARIMFNGYGAAASHGGTIEFFTRAFDSDELKRMMTVAVNGVRIGEQSVATTTALATLDVIGFQKLSLNSSAPVVCDTTRRGAMAMTSAAMLCVCRSTGWVVANTSTACSW